VLADNLYEDILTNALFYFRFYLLDDNAQSFLLKEGLLSTDRKYFSKQEPNITKELVSKGVFKRTFCSNVADGSILLQYKVY